MPEFTNYSYAPKTLDKQVQEKTIKLLKMQFYNWLAGFILGEG